MTPRPAPAVSVVMPAYNAAATVGEAIASVRGQSCADWELLVVDDASTDGTAAAARALAAEDPRITFMESTTNAGPAAARNRGIDAARGAFIAFLDADDMWLPEKLARQLALMEKTGCPLCCTGYVPFGGEGEGRPHTVPDIIDYHTLLGENVVGLSTAMVRRAALGALRFDGSYFHEDYQLWLRLLKSGATARGLPEVLVRYRTGGRNAGKARAARHRWDVYRRSEGLPLPAAAWHMARYALSGLRKHL